MRNNQAVFLMIAAAFLWSLGGLFIKLVDWHPLVIAGIRSGIAGMVMYAFSGKLPKTFSKATWYGAFCYVLLASSFIAANKLTTSTNAIMLQFTAPIWLALIATFVLKQPIKKRDALVIVAVMFGIVLFFVGDLSYGKMLGNLLGIFAGIIYAVMITIMKENPQANPLHMTLLGSGLLCLVGIPFAFLYPPTLTVLSLSGIIILGVFQLGLGYVFFTKALPHVSTLDAVIIPVIEPLFNPLWVLLFMGEKPGPYALVGGTVVIFTIVWKEVMDTRDKVRLKRIRPHA